MSYNAIKSHHKDNKNNFNNRKENLTKFSCGWSRWGVKLITSLFTVKSTLITFIKWYCHGYLSNKYYSIYSYFERVHSILNPTWKLLSPHHLSAVKSIRALFSSPSCSSDSLMELRAIMTAKESKIVFNNFSISLHSPHWLLRSFFNPHSRQFFFKALGH